MGRQLDQPTAASISERNALPSTDDHTSDHTPKPRKASTIPTTELTSKDVISMAASRLKRLSGRSM